MLSDLKNSRSCCVNRRLWSMKVCDFPSQIHRCPGTELSSSEVCTWTLISLYKGKDHIRMVVFSFILQLSIPHATHLQKRSFSSSLLWVGRKGGCTWAVSWQHGTQFYYDGMLVDEKTGSHLLTHCSRKNGSLRRPLHKEEQNTSVFRPFRPPGCSN